MSVTITVRVHEYLKKDFEILCKDRGYNPFEVFAIFESEYIRTGKKPFSLGEPYCYGNEKDTRIAVTLQNKEAFEAACKKYDNASVSRIIRDFINHCVSNFYLPVKNKGKYELILEDLQEGLEERYAKYRAELNDAIDKMKPAAETEYIRGIIYGIDEARKLMNELQSEYVSMIKARAMGNLK